MDVVTLLSGILERSRIAICVADPSQPDCPLIYVNRAFEALSGYDRAEVLGRNCRFLQGLETDARDLAEIRSLVEMKSAGDGVLLNYRKDGSRFHNYLILQPIRFGEGPRYILGSQFDFSPETRQASFDAHLAHLSDQLTDTRLVAPDMAREIRAGFAQRAKTVVERLRRYGWAPD